MTLEEYHPNVTNNSGILIVSGGNSMSYTDPDGTLTIPCLERTVPFQESPLLGAHGASTPAPSHSSSLRREQWEFEREMAFPRTPVRLSVESWKVESEGPNSTITTPSDFSLLKSDTERSGTIFGQKSAFQPVFETLPDKQESVKYESAPRAAVRATEAPVQRRGLEEEERIDSIMNYWDGTLVRQEPEGTSEMVSRDQDVVTWLRSISPPPHLAEEQFPQVEETARPEEETDSDLEEFDCIDERKEAFDA